MNFKTMRWNNIMKACVLHDIADLRYENVKTPVPKEGEVLVKIKASGICGSDIARVFTKGTYNFPTIPGHEFSGRVVQLGQGVNEEYLNKKVTIFPLLPCRECEACQIGEYAQCKDYNYFGSRCDGGFAEYIAVPIWNLLEIPQKISYEEAAMTEPAAVAIHALRQVGIEIGDNIAIFGAGPIGLMLGKWAEAWGADKVILIDINEEKITFAKKQGFKYVWNSNNGDPISYIKKITLDRGVDIAVEGAGVSKTLEQCLESTRIFGRIVIMGNPLNDMHLEQKIYWQILRKQLTIKGTWNSNFVSLPKNDWKLALRAIETEKLSVKSFITHKFAFTECNKALNMMKESSEFYNKVMFIAE